MAPNINECTEGAETAAQYVVRMAQQKARHIYQQLQHGSTDLVIAADTCIEVNEKILGKPENRQHAISMLGGLSDQTHQVWSAVCMISRSDVSVQPIQRDVLNTSDVTLRKIEVNELASYWQTGEPTDKAGAYAIQGLAAMFVKNINGSYSGVMGLPLYETAELLKQFGVDVLATDLTTE